MPVRTSGFSGRTMPGVILLWAAHVEGARFDFEAGRSLRDAEMQDRVRLETGGRLPGGRPGAGPDHRNDRCRNVQSRRGGRLFERESQRGRGVVRNAGKRAEPRNEHANGLIG